MEGEDECLILFVAIVDAVVIASKEALVCFVLGRFNNVITDVVFVAFEESRLFFVHLVLR